MLDAIDPTTVQPAMEDAKAANIPVVGITGGGSATAAYQPVGSGDHESQPAAMAWIALQSGGTANILTVTVTGNAETTAAAEAGAAALAEVCPSCTLNSVQVTASQTESVPSAVSTALLRNPNVTYGFPQFDFLAPLFQSGARTAGKPTLPIVSTNAVLSQMQLVQSGGQAADIGANRNYAGWLAVDALVRLVAGAPPATSPQIPVRIFDKTNIGSISLTQSAAVTGEWFGPMDYKQQFPALWKVG